MLFGLIFLLSDAPHCETHGGRSRPDTAQATSIACARSDKGTGNRCQLTGGPFPELVSSRDPPPPEWQYKINIIRTKARGSEGRKKKTQPKRHQGFDCFALGGAFGRRTGIHWKKRGRRKTCACFLLVWSHFLREQPHYDTHGGCGCAGIAQGPSNTCVRPAQGTGSRPGLSGAPFPIIASSGESPHHTTT